MLCSFLTAIDRKRLIRFPPYLNNTRSVCQTRLMYLLSRLNTCLVRCISSPDIMCNISFLLNTTIRWLSIVHSSLVCPFSHLIVARLALAVVTITLLCTLIERDITQSMYLAPYSNQTTRRGLFGLNVFVFHNSHVANVSYCEVSYLQLFYHFLYELGYFCLVRRGFGGVPDSLYLDGGFPCDNLFHCYNILSCAILHSVV